jgi:hypothetical protein
MTLHNDYRLWIRFLHNADGHPTFLDFRAEWYDRLVYYFMTRRLQRFWRRVRTRARRQALFMGLHPRLGANSPIVEDIVANMVMFSLI